MNVCTCLYSSVYFIYEGVLLLCFVNYAMCAYDKEAGEAKRYNPAGRRTGTDRF